MKKTLTKVLGIIIIGMILAMATLFVSVSLNLPDISGYTYSPKLKTQILTEKSELVGEIYDENRTYVSIDEMPENLKNAVVAVEDRRFYQHHGFDLRGIFRAVVVNLKGDGIHEGGSTLTQQVVRRLFLSDERTYSRKIKEILLSVKFEQEFSKEEILEIYLNDVFMGQGTYGVEEASKRFFDKHVNELTLEECALLAGIPQAPSVYNPTTESGYEESKIRKEEVLDSMVESGYITQEECEEAKAVEISISKEDSQEGFNGRIREGCGAYSERVLSEAQSVLTNSFMTSGQMTEEEAKAQTEQMINQDGLKIYCSLNMDLQTSGVKSVSEFMSENGLEDSADMAFTTVDGSSGKVVAYYGGSSAIDMANTPRQPGSTIKPLYVSKYLEMEGKSIYTTVQDGPINLYGYSPKNAGNRYMGRVTVQQAIANSLNTACLRLFDEMGVDENGNLAGFEAVKDFGFSTLVEVEDDPYYNDNNYAFALGGLTYGLKPLELANAYSTFANDGEKYPYYFVEKITTNDGRVLYEREEREPERIRTSQANAAIIECMKDVVNYGTGTPARTQYETFGKTGTTNDNKDFWFCGVTGDLATSIWVGTPSNEVIYGISSSTVASFYSKYVNNTDEISNFGAIANVVDDDTEEQEVTYTSLLVARDDIDITNREYFTRLEVETITVPESEVENYQNRIVTQVTVDSESGLLFDESKCSNENKEIRYYSKSKAPTKKCDKLHLF